ncbi:MAG: peroxide stress protein YaaA [Microbacteriaceae bacterium]|nr:peroxide stress protein YaaA [Microbacteriaceae bacterium]
MLILLPPSETKRPGGIEGTRLDLAALSFPELTPQRRALVEALRVGARDEAATMTALKLGPTQAGEVRRNRSIRTSPVMPAIDRYDGVLFDALDAATLTPAQRAFAGRHVAISSAAFGLTGALDPLPAYRLSHDSRLPGMRLAAIWREPLTELLASTTGLILDLRSEAYAVLGPVPDRPNALYVRVVSEDGSGRRRALNHFNKAGKGAFVRRVLEAGRVHECAESLLDWAKDSGVRLQRGAVGELDLVV